MSYAWSKIDFVLAKYCIRTAFSLAHSLLHLAMVETAVSFDGVNTCHGHFVIFGTQCVNVGVSSISVIWLSTTG